jgi:hypothetical protein
MAETHDTFIPAATLPSRLLAFEERWQWLTQHVHADLGYVRGATTLTYDAAAHGWHVRGPRREPAAATPPRGPGGRFVKKG